MSRATACIARTRLTTTETYTAAEIRRHDLLLTLVANISMSLAAVAVLAVAIACAVVK